jgi:hypothetical protein
MRQCCPIDHQTQASHEAMLPYRPPDSSKPLGPMSSCRSLGTNHLQQPRYHYYHHHHHLMYLRRRRPHYRYYHYRLTYLCRSSLSLLLLSPHNLRHPHSEPVTATMGACTLPCPFASIIYHHHLQSIIFSNRHLRDTMYQHHSISATSLHSLPYKCQQKHTAQACRHDQIAHQALQYTNMSKSSGIQTYQTCPNKFL